MLYHYLKIIYHSLTTIILYKPKALKMGKRIMICNPMLVTATSLKFGSHIIIQDYARIEGITVHQGKTFNPVIQIDNGVTIEQNLHLTCANSIVIGKDTSIAANVTITDIVHIHDDVHIRSALQSIKFFNVIIGENCRIYNNAVILPGTILGKHCIVGANSVVLGKKYEDYSIITGAPAKIVKRYSTEKKKWLKTDPKGNFI